MVGDISPYMGVDARYAPEWSGDLLLQHCGCATSFCHSIFLHALITYHSCDACIYWDETLSSVQTIHLLLLPLCSAAAAVFLVPSPTCHRRRESRSPKPMFPHIPAWGRPGVCWSPSTVCFIYSRAISSADNPTVRMSTLPLTFVVASLLILALGSLSLPWIIVLVLNHTSRIYVVVLFLNIRINLCIIKLLLFWTRIPCLVYTHSQKGDKTHKADAHDRFNYYCSNNPALICFNLFIHVFVITLATS
jgi:hypothetical protein